MQDDRQGRIVLQTQGDCPRDLLESVTQWIAHMLEGRANCTVEGELIARSRSDIRFVPTEPESLSVPAVEMLRITDPPRPPDQIIACVSYAWREELSNDPERAGKVEEFCTKLTASGRSIDRSIDRSFATRRTLHWAIAYQSSCVRLGTVIASTFSSATRISSHRIACMNC